MSRTRRDHTPPLNPELLRDQHWLVHRDKRPYYSNGRPRSGTLDAPEDLGKLTCYDDAVAALNKGRFTGLGFAINRGYQFIDLDKCRNPDTGRVDKWVAPLMAKAEEIGAFIEVSISGTGIHIVGKGGNFPTFRGAHVELYDHGRYMAMGRTIRTGTDPLPDLGPVVDLMDVDKMPRPERPALRLVAGKAPPLWSIERAKLPALLEILNPGMGYSDWIRVGMAIHASSGGVEEGLGIWDAWSQDDEKYVEGECARMWAGFKAGGGVTFGTLVYMAHGDEEPVSLPVVPAPSGRRKRVSDDELVETEHAPQIWPVEGLVPPGLTLLAAPPKAGKSYFVLQMGLCVASGKPFLGRDTNKVKVTYFDLEEWEELLQERRRNIGRAHRIVKPDIEYVLELEGNGTTAKQDIQRAIDEGSKLIIIDLLARIRDEMSEDAKKNAYVRDYAALREYAELALLPRNHGVAVVIVHHTNKGNHEEWQNKISGSQGLAGATHSNMMLESLSKRGLDADARKETTKYRHLHFHGKALKADELMLVMMENGGGWAVSDKTDEDVKTQSKKAHILQVLREADGAWVTAKEMFEQVEGTLASTRQMLQRMARKGDITSSGRGGDGYRLP